MNINGLKKKHKSLAGFKMKLKKDKKRNNYSKIIQIENKQRKLSKQIKDLRRRKNRK